MPPTKDTLRVGETIQLEASVFNSLGERLTDVANPSFDAQAGNGTIINVFLISGWPLRVNIEGVAPGPDLLEFSCADSFDNGVFADTPVLVLDGSKLIALITDQANCAVRHGQGRFFILVDPEPAGDPSFTLNIKCVDNRGPGSPSYDLSDGPDSVSTHGRIILNGHGAGDPNPDDADVPCVVTERGDETITLSGVTDATSTPVSGVVNFTIVTASTASIAQVHTSDEI